MSTRLCNVVVDAADPTALAEFWVTLLDWRVSHADAEEVDVVAPPDDGWKFDLVFVPVADQKVGKNRVHLDLSSASPDHQAAIVAHAEALGAVRVDVGQRNVPWIVLADPEGNEFCVLEQRPEYAATGAIAAVVVDVVDPLRQSEFWSGASGWPVVETTAATASLRSPDGRGPWLEFVRTGEPHRVKNRVHLDVAPLAGEDQWAEVTRLAELGARKVDVGQGSVPWEVMADVEGNEFCVLTPR
ncbi:VOC family protein [Actinophytocola algeriensis]|uniref:Putative enzyme related to lactoylglutathione lyase n=1 Tax=Actinophytocola algeriensis TaxID=1768010 RepID=A0A7W7Q0Y8_9PSEU|nr:VOC family protein [Actinophytocola algeriensis]MBB4904838.1 putative enzyme related to lactoylglutathione lyase [Actinophytocola algeriensis]MBE1476303.1 putative enzyme related to lactoylglutathione lyase [Actinophytocola algeriensis]